MRVSGLENSCPRCGKKFDQDVKFECPFCGELILVGAKKCPVCLVDLSGISEQAKPASAKETMDALLDDLIEIESEQVKKEDKRFCCPNCAWLLDGTETRCPKCGQVLTGKLGLQCPICGTPVEKGLKQCPKCSIALEKVVEEAKPIIPVVPSQPGKSTLRLKVEEVANSHTCPVCGSVYAGNLEKCPTCGAAFVEVVPQVKTVEEVKEAAKELEAEEALLALSEIEKQAQKPHRERKLKTDKVTTLDFKEKPTPAGLSNGVGRVNGRSKINGIGMVNGRSKINGTGLVNGRSKTNGLGLVNGRSKVNGLGAVNGKSLVNGTGISNGLRSRGRTSASRRMAFFMRWQFLAVLVAIAIIIPAFLYLSYSKQSDNYAVDGKFDEWDGATIYGTRIPSSSSGTNITEWAVSTQSSDLFLYFRTQSLMMSTSEAASFYLFVDADGSNSTGYIMESLGADCMLRLTGWDNAVDSTSISEYASSSDQYNWSAWDSKGSFSFSTDGIRLEAEARMPVTIGHSAKFMLISKDSLDRSSVSYVAPLSGGVLIAQQVPSDEVAADGRVPKSSAVAMMTLRFTCQGEGGHVDQVTPIPDGAPIAEQIAPFSLDEGDEHLVTVTVDTSSAADGQFVSVEILASGIVSSFASVDIIGEGSSAYVVSPPPAIEIDGAFADWEGRLSADFDSMTVQNPGVDIDEVGNVSTTDNSYFYVSVAGQMCSGTFVPASVTKPSGSGGGVVVFVPRHTAEDTLRILIDSDRNNTTGEQIIFDSKVIGADQMIEVKGLFGRITSTIESNYSSGAWAQTSYAVEAAKDTSRIEIGVSAASLGGSSDIDYVVETTTWKALADMATYDPMTVGSLTRSWVIDSSTTSTYATAMSYQRKLFYDGSNIWSFYFDGSNTVCRYSSDSGATWASPSAGSRPFQHNGVTNASFWYDSTVNTVYAVGDPNTSSAEVYVRQGVVNPSSQTITWSGSDSAVIVSSYASLGKNTFISKDASGYLWMMSSIKNASDELYDLAAFRSSFTNSTSSWTDTGHMLSTAYTLPNAKGSILPAGSGSQVWAVYGYDGKVASRKYDGSSWQGQEVVYNGGTSKGNTDTAPPCALVDDAGILHVVFGDGTRKGQESKPQPYHAARNATAWSNLHSLYITTGQEGCFNPTISLDMLTDRLYAFWILDDGAPTRHWTVNGKYNTTSSWDSWGLNPIYTSADTTSPKQYLTSIYSAPNGQLICFQWTQNTTVADLEVIFDKIPEFGDLALPFVCVLMIALISRVRRRARSSG